jgi:DNA topoisomerase-1
MRLVVEREREILRFTSLVYFVIDADLQVTPDRPRIRARLQSWLGKEIGQTWTSVAMAEDARGRCQKGHWSVGDVERKEVLRYAPEPFITSTVQMAASVKLGMNPKDTMAALQRLFEAGEITYHRTDSPALAPEAIQGARAWIAENLPAEYLPTKPNTFSSKDGAQEAHEAIRPTHWEKGPRAVTGAESALYEMIWQRFIASQCAPGKDRRTTIAIHVRETGPDPIAIFLAKGVVCEFDGWRRITDQAENEKPDKEAMAGDLAEDEVILPKVEPKDPLALLKLDVGKCTTKPPSRYSQSSLIKRLEKEGVGRPSTYATIMATIMKRGYVEEDKKRRLHGTPLGQDATDFLCRHFTGDFIDVPFTRTVEQSLDTIAQGQLNWEEYVTRMVLRLLDLAKQAGLPHDPIHGQGAAVPGEECPACPSCGKAMVRRTGPRGEFWGCRSYPKCKGILPMGGAESGTVAASSSVPSAAAQTNDESASKSTVPPCPTCGKPMVKRSGPRGGFWGCSGYPECRGLRPVASEVKDKATTKASSTFTCPLCSSPMVEKKIDKWHFFSCAKYPTCKGTRQPDGSVRKMRNE